MCHGEALAVKPSHRFSLFVNSYSELSFHSSFLTFMIICCLFILIIFKKNTTYTMFLTHKKIVYLYVYYSYMNQKVLHPDFPVIEGEYFLSKNWKITLPVPFNRRIENDSLVLWKPGLTFWMEQFGYDSTRSPKERVLTLTHKRNEKASDYKEFETGSLYIAQYFLEEENEGKQVFTYNYFIASEESLLLVCAYADGPTVCKISKQICQTIKQNL